MNQSLSPRFDEALVFATDLHRNQRRKVSGMPYVAHLLAVAAFVLEDGGNEEEAIAALLHDAIEDQGGIKTREAIRDRFGDVVVTIVEGCTEWNSPPKPPWKERKLHYIEQVRQASLSIQRVSLADKLHNARSLLLDWWRIGDQVWDSFNQGKAEMLWFYRELAPIYRATGSSLAIEFKQVIEQLDNGTSL
jgi:(p)ppGpp synthase/HD superfamily hydrolase